MRFLNKLEKIEFIKSFEKDLKFTFISIDDNNNITLICNICKMQKNIIFDSFKKSLQTYKKKQMVHNSFCVKQLRQIIIEDIGEAKSEKFFRTYRIAKERCCNPNNKDYSYYKGKFKFKDFTSFYYDCYDNFKEAIQTHDIHDLSIDRINTTKGYEQGNIRFVTMLENLRNKVCIQKVRMININTNEIIIGESVKNLCENYGNINSASSIKKALIHNKLYKKEWKIEYIETQSTIENTNIEKHDIGK